MHTRWPGKGSPPDKLNSFTEAYMYAHNRKTTAWWQHIGTQFKSTNLNRHAGAYNENFNFKSTPHFNYFQNSYSSLSSSSAAERLTIITRSHHPH